MYYNPASQPSPYIYPKSLHISRAVSNFYGTEIKIWAGFGSVGNTEKKIGPKMSNFRGRFFHVFMGKKTFKFFLDTVASPLM